MAPRGAAATPPRSAAAAAGSRHSRPPSAPRAATAPEAGGYSAPGSPTPRQSDLERLAKKVFATLAKGEDAIPLEEFKRCCTILAQVSDDFAMDPSQAADRMDLNGDDRIDEGEFIQEVSSIGSLVGLRKVMGALEQVVSVAADFSAKAEAEVLEEEAASQRTPAAMGPQGAGRAASASTFAAGFRGPGTAPPGGRKPIFGGYPRGGADAGGGAGLALDIRQKPLHPRGGRGRKGQLRAREKVIENMLNYFKGLREEYERKLSSVKHQREDLDDREEVGIRFTPTRPHGLVVSRRQGAPTTPGDATGAASAAEGADGDSEGGADGSARDGGSDAGGGVAGSGEALEHRVEAVEPGSQAEEKGVEPEWLIDKVNGEDFTHERLAAAQAGEEDYFVVFFKTGAGAAEDLDPTLPRKVFADVEVRPIGGEAEDEEDDEDGDDEEDDEDGEGEEDAADALAKYYQAKSGKADEEEEEEEGEEEDEDDGEEEDGDEEAEEDEDDEEDDEDEEDADAETGAAKRDKDAEVAAAEAAAKAKAEEEAAAAASAAAAADAAAATDAAAAEAAAAEAAAAGAASKKKKKASKKPKKVKQDEAPKSAGSPPPDTSTAASPEPAADEGEEAGARGGVTKAVVKAGKGGKAKLDEEGIFCMKTLDMGLAIRSAICAGKEVWCADWKGAVTIRERDDASSVKAEIPTNKYIWCMAVQEPSLIWMGQESQGISLFHMAKKEYKTVLTGGHTGGVYCLALDEGLGDEEPEGGFPTRRAWSGSNDFTIRQWWVETWLAKQPAPKKVKAASNKYSVLELGKYKVGIAPGLVMHGHTNGVRALLRIGPALWSGSDDGTIRIWSCNDGECAEVIEEAHKGSVLKLAVVRSFVWSAGADGVIKEWQLGGNQKTMCVRQFAVPGFEKSCYGIVPIGRDVWSIGHHPNIRMLSQASMQITEEYEAHQPFVSNLLAVDRVETRILWSTSIGDRKLKVWRHTIRGNLPNMDELKAANGLYEREAQSGAEKLEKLLASLAEMEAELEMAGLEYRGQLDDLARQLAEEQAAKDDLDEKRRFLEAEMEGLRKLFEEAGLAHLLQDPEALRTFLDIKRLFDEAGLGHLLTDPEALKKFLALGQALKDMGMERFLSDPDAFKAFMKRAKQIEELLKALGLEDAWNDPRKLKRMLESYLQLKKVLEDYGMADALKDPSILAEVLSRYTALKKAFEEHDYSDMFEDPTYTLSGFLKNYRRIRDEFRNVDLEYLLDSPAAMRDFLAKNKEAAEQLKEMQALHDKIALLQSLLEKANKDIASMKGDLEEFAKWKEVCSSLEDLKKMKEEAGQYRTLRKMKKAQDKELEEARRLLEEKERERQEALERERQMAMKYKELDIFKLDIIARELKALDQELNLVGKEAKALLTDASRLRNMDERENIAPHGDKILDQCKDHRSHIRDVINKCLSETQKFHIGVALDDPTAAGELQDGGVMAGYVCEEVDGPNNATTKVEKPDYGNSKAARLCQDDALKREREMHRDREMMGSRGSLPKIDPGRRSPGGQWH